MAPISRARSFSTLYLKNHLTTKHRIFNSNYKRYFSMAKIPSMYSKPDPKNTALFICDVQEVFRTKVVGEMKAVSIGIFLSLIMCLVRGVYKLVVKYI